jgi:hypothetical protein
MDQKRFRFKDYLLLQSSNCEHKRIQDSQNSVPTSGLDFVHSHTVVNILFKFEWCSNIAIITLLFKLNSSKIFLSTYCCGRG